MLRIYICGDNTSVSREVRFLLAELGHTVVAAGGGIDDISASYPFVRPDLAFVACVSPRAQGLDLIRELQHRRPVPLILLVEHSSAALLREAVSAGASLVLEAPMDGKALAGAIDIAQVRHQDLLELRDLRERIKTTTREFVHRIKNDLAVITSLLHFQADSCGNAETAAAILEGADRVRVISALYDIIRSAEYRDHLRFDHYLELLLSKISQGISEESGIFIEVSADYLVMDGAGALNCGLIVRELVANALKYAFPGGGKEKRILVTLRTNPDENLVEIRVADNGIGLPADIDPAMATTFGFQLVSFLMGQLKGTMDVVRAGGTAVRIRFKAPRVPPAIPGK